MRSRLPRWRLLGGGILLSLCLAVLCLVLRTPPAPSTQALVDIGETQALLDSPSEEPRLTGQERTRTGTEQTAPAPPPAALAQDSSPASVHRIRVRFEGPGAEPELVGLRLVADGDWDNSFSVVFGPSRTAKTSIRGSRYDVMAIILDKWVSDQTDTEVHLVSPGLYEVVLELPGQTVLRVKEAPSGQPLPEAYAYPASGSVGYGAALPTPPADCLARKPRQADDAGQIALPRTSSSKAWWVGAPGRAWSRVLSSPHKADVDVALAAGGALRVEVRSPGPLPPYAIRIARLKDGQEVDRLPHGELSKTGEGRFYVQGLQSGSWRVLIGRDTNLFLREVWIYQDVHVVAGQTDKVIIQVPEQEVVERHDLRAELVVPRAWESPPTHVWLRGALEENETFTQEIQIEAGGRGSPWPLLWKDVPRGLYTVTAYPFQQAWYVRVPEDGSGLRLEVPPPVQVEVGVVDALSGKAIPEAEVTIWPRVERPPEVTGWGASGERAYRRKPRGPLFARVRAGLVEIHGQAPGYVSHRVPAELVSAARPHQQTLRLVRGATVIVRVLSDGELLRTAVGVVECRHETPDAAEEEDWGWESTHWKLGSGSARVEGLAAGTYSLSVSLAGKKNTQPKRIVVKAGERRSIDFDLSGD